MADLTAAAKTWLTERHQAVLITLRRDGSPQSSNITTAFDGDIFRISVTTDRAKTHNLRRDPRAVLHVLGEDFWSYGSLSCTAELSPVTESPGDATGQELLRLYDSISARSHPDVDDFFRAMVDEGRLVVRLTPTSIAGHGWA